MVHVAAVLAHDAKRCGVVLMAEEVCLAVIRHVPEPFECEAESLGRKPPSPELRPDGVSDVPAANGKEVTA